MTDTKETEANNLAVGWLRISVGLLFVVFGQYKVFGSAFTLGGGFQSWINQFLGGGVYPFMRPVLQQFVLPHATPIAFLVAYGELAIGLSLVLGIWVRVASGFGLVYMLTLLLSSNFPGAQAPFWQYFGASLGHLVPALCFGCFLIGRPSATLSTAGLRGRKAGGWSR